MLQSDRNMPLYMMFCFVNRGYIILVHLQFKSVISFLCNRGSEDARGEEFTYRDSWGEQLQEKIQVS